MLKKFVIYTDLDGTLLDHVTYTFHPALDALEFVEKKNVPLIICTSKTRLEIEFYRKLLHNKEPFISENGGGIFIPEGYFKHEFKYDKEIKGYKIIELGTPESVLHRVLKAIEEKPEIGLRRCRDLIVIELQWMKGGD